MGIAATPDARVTVQGAALPDSAVVVLSFSHPIGTPLLLPSAMGTVIVF
jgi:hypothetical protein